MKTTFEYIGILLLIVFAFTINIPITALLVIGVALVILEVMSIGRKLSSIMEMMEVFQSREWGDEEPDITL